MVEVPDTQWAVSRQAWGGSRLVGYFEATSGSEPDGGALPGAITLPHMKQNPLLAVRELGQSVWLDLIRRGMLGSGELRRLIREDGLLGVTSNPAIFEKAIAGTHDYDQAIQQLAARARDAETTYEMLAVQDIQDAADEFRPVYDSLDGRDGFVSLEVSPRLAEDTAGTLREARRLWSELDRPNVLIKVPGTAEGLPAIRQLISEGISVNVTLLFGLPRYRDVANAYMEGMTARLKAGKPLEHVASVASFFLSRIDALIDPVLDRIKIDRPEVASMAASLRGQVATASAKLAYQGHKELFGGERFRPLREAGARPQRLLWASTSAKDPAYSDVKYVEALIGPGTVNTLPLETLEAYRDHGRPAARIEEGVAAARQVLMDLGRIGIDLGEVTRQLELEGIEKFKKPFAQLLRVIGEKLAAGKK